MATSPRLGMELIQQGVEASLELGNESFSVLEQVCQTSIISRSTSAQPTEPEEGDAYVLPSSPTGDDWSGQAGSLAVYYGGWIFLPNVTGFRTWVVDENAIVVINAVGGALIGSGNMNILVIEGTPPSYKVPVLYTPGKVNFDRIQVVLQGGSSAICDIDLRFGPDMSAIGTEMLTADLTVSNETTGQEAVVVQQPTSTSGVWLWVVFTSASGTFDRLTISFEYHKV